MLEKQFISAVYLEYNSYKELPSGQIQQNQFITAVYLEHNRLQRIAMWTDNSVKTNLSPLYT